MQKLGVQYLLGFTDAEVQLRYESEQNKTKQKQTNLYPLFQLKDSILLIRGNFFSKNTLIQWLEQIYKIYLIEKGSFFIF